MNCEWSAREFHELTLEELYDIIRLRQDVFVVEQQCCYQDLDGEDQQATHLMARAVDGRLIGYQRIFAPGVLADEPIIGRIIVAGSARGTGFGAELVKRGIALVHQRHPGTTIRIAAQAHLQQFYGRLGFATISETYPVDNIPHVDMLLRP